MMGCDQARCECDCSHCLAPVAAGAIHSPAVRDSERYPGCETLTLGWRTCSACAGSGVDAKAVADDCESIEAAEAAVSCETCEGEGEVWCDL